MRIRIFKISFAVICAGLFLTLLGIMVTKNTPVTAHADEPVLSVTGSGGNVEVGREVTYHLELLNHTDKIVYDGVISITLPTGFSYIPNSTLIMGEGWPIGSDDPVINGQTLTWGPHHLPSAGITAHNPYGIHTMMHECQPGLHLEGAKMLVGNGGYAKQLFYGIDTSTTGPSECTINFVFESYARNLIPILRLQGHFVNGVWQKPDPGPDGDYSEIAAAYARYVSGLPLRNTNPIYIEIWNEPDLWIEWSGSPNATQYARFFVAVSNAIKQLGDARIRVINGALTPGNMTFLKQMLGVPGFKDAFDVWSTHCYPYNHPASYNIHNGTARYDTYAIDCYLNELNVINSYGRANVKVIISETGYELGNNTFGFEGYAAINETNRAGYIGSAFANYWQNWPEVVAVTPFQLGDSDGQWQKFDWVYPYSPYNPHPQFDTVAALPKPVGEWQPYGYQVTFKAKVNAGVQPGIYTSRLDGSERDGHTAFAVEAAPVQVTAAGTLEQLYLPVIHGSPLGNDGPWTMSVQEPPSPGAIVPSHFAQPQESENPITLSAGTFSSIPLDGDPQHMVLDDTLNLGVVAVANLSNDKGQLQIINLNNEQIKFTANLNQRPNYVALKTPGTDQAYVSLSDGIALVDLQSDDIIRQLSGLGHLRGIVYDAATQRVLAADSTHDRLLILTEDLSQLIDTYSLPEQPDQIFFDSHTRRIYLAFPATSQIIALNADTLELEIEAQTKITGSGPLIDLVFDPAGERLYVLNLLAPAYRGITVLETPTLKHIALIAGVEEFPLQHASAMALTPQGQLFVAEETGLWQIDPISFIATQRYPATVQIPARGLQANQNGVVYVLESLTHQLRIYQ